MENTITATSITEGVCSALYVDGRNFTIHTRDRRFAKSVADSALFHCAAIVGLLQADNRQINLCHTFYCFNPLSFYIAKSIFTFLGDFDGVLAP